MPNPCVVKGEEKAGISKGGRRGTGVGVAISFWVIKSSVEEKKLKNWEIQVG